MPPGLPIIVYVPKSPGETFERILHERVAAGIELHFGQPPDRCAILVDGRPSADDLARWADDLRAVVIPFAGLPASTRSLLSAHPHLACHNIHHNAAPTAEMAIGLMIAATKRIVHADQAMRRGDWTIRYEDQTAPLLAGRTALVLGFGAIGRRISRALQALDVRVLAIRRSVQSASNDAGAIVHPASDLHALLPRADILIITLPHTPETERLIDASTIARLPRGAILINVGRGAIVDEAALYSALTSGRLGAAGLDVWWQYPEGEAARKNTPPSSQPFGELANVVLSPHRAGHGEATERLRAEHLADLLNHAAEGRAMPHRIDPSRGY